MSNAVKIIIAMFVFGLALGIVSFFIRPANHYDSEMISRIDKVLVNVNSRTPITLDKVTVLQSVDLDGKAINYNLKFQNMDIPAENITKFSYIQKMLNVISACHAPDIPDFIENGYEVVFYYKDDMKNKLFTNTVSKADCHAIKSDDIAEILQYYVDNNIPALPLKIDDLTIWQDIAIEREPKHSNPTTIVNRLVLTYKLFTKLKKDIDIGDFKKKMGFVTFQKNCMTPEMRLILSKGGSVMDSYVDKNDVLITSFKTDRERCLQSAPPQQ